MRNLPSRTDIDSPSILVHTVISLVITFMMLLIFGNQVMAQTRLELIHSDVTRGAISPEGEAIRILEGNVHVRQDTVELWCDRAVFYPASERVVLTGNVHIRRGSEELTAQQVTYYDRLKIAIAKNKVHVRRPKRHLFSEYLKYYYENDQAYAHTRLKLIDQERSAYVTAREGEYLPEKNLATVRYQAHFWQVDSSSGDTIHIYSHKMDYIFHPNRTAIARDSVKILRGDMVAFCDSAVYLLDDSKAYLEIHPRAQQRNNTLSGNQMELFFDGMKIQKIIIRGNALVTSVADSLHRKIDKLSGDEIHAFVVNDKLDRLWAINHAKSYYHIKQDGKIQGVNQASADTIKVFFKNQEVDYITVIGGTQGIYYPEGYQTRQNEKHDAIKN
ncbi:MAG: hypothetical protein D6748_05165 [Calditrichaeota bacterium]|nr:MAG: hypothetical protein D6748_05165 [Calditrichota bacterium]